MNPTFHSKTSLMNPSNPRGIRVPFMGRGARPTEHRHLSTAATPCPQEYFDRRCLVGSVDDSFVLLFRKYAGWIRRRFFSRLGFVSSSLTPPPPTPFALVALIDGLSSLILLPHLFPPLNPAYRRACWVRRAACAAFAVCARRSRKVIAPVHPSETAK